MHEAYIGTSEQFTLVYEKATKGNEAGEKDNIHVVRVLYKN